MHALLLDPGEAPVPSQNDTRGAAFRCRNHVGPLKAVLSGLHHTACNARCLRFAGTVTRDPRKTRFRLVARPFTERDSVRYSATRQVCSGRFQSLQRHVMTSPFPGLSLAQRDLTPLGLLDDVP